VPLRTILCLKLEQITLQPIKIATPTNPLVPLLAALWIGWGFGLNTVGKRLYTELDGVVISSIDVPATRDARYRTDYVLRGSDGREYSYVAGATDASLPRSLPVGTHLTKRKWRLDYVQNGQTIDDFPITMYAIVFGIGLLCLRWSFSLWRDLRRSKT
jgi:hypothetical protein